MSLTNGSPVYNMKDHRFDGGDRLIDFELGDTLTSKIASLSLQASVVNMTTPPAVLTPSPPPQEKTDVSKFSHQKDPDFQVEIIQVQDSERVLEFLSRNFFVDEPLNQAIGLLSDKDDRCLELEDFSVCDIHQGLSVMAVDNDGKILGVLLGAAVYKEKYYEEEDWSITCEHPKFKKIQHFLYTSERACDIFSFYPDLESFLDIKILSVDSTCRGRGIGGYLTKKVFSLARTAKLGFLKLDCTSNFSGKIAEKLGCKVNYCVKYDDYKVNGETIFSPAPPHTHFSIKSTRL